MIFDYFPKQIKKISVRAREVIGVRRPRKPTGLPPFRDGAGQGGQGKADRGCANWRTSTTQRVNRDSPKG
jgi:hypothetical protein